MAAATVQRLRNDRRDTWNVPAADRVGLSATGCCEFMVMGQVNASGDPE
jgi:hypothetical protein